MAGHKQGKRYLLITVASLATLVSVWELVTVTGLVRSLLLPSPTAIVSEFGLLVSQGYDRTPLHVHVGISLFRVVSAFVLGAVLGVGLGLVMGYYRVIDAIMAALTEIVRPIPPLALIPLFILWFGIGEVAKVLVIMYSAMLIILINTVAGVRAVPTDKIRAALSLGANDWQTFVHVILPSARPHILTGFRVGMGSAFSVLVASELVAAKSGLGFMISDASIYLRTSDLFVGIVLIGAFGFAFDRLFKAVHRRLVHWEGKA